MIDINNELYWAARYGNIIRVKLMLKLGADIHSYNNAALLWSARNGHKNVCEVLLEHGADVHAESNVALWLAAYYDHKDVCELLLENGANIDDTLEYTKRYYIEDVCNDVKNLLMQVQNELK